MSGKIHLPQAVVFDLGKVLLDFDYRIVARHIAARSKLTADAVAQLIEQSPLLFRYETGHLTREEFYREICGATGYGGTREQFATDFADQFTPLEPMLAVHARLRQEQVPVFIFSNTNDIAIEFIRERYSFFAHFDGYVYSYEERAMKPHPAIYEAVERLTGLSGRQIAYIDDREENVAAGAARGWHAIHHQHAGQTQTILGDLGLPVTQPKTRPGTTA